MYTGWELLGQLGNRENVYYQPNGDLAVEKDHTFLVTPTEGEMYEICETYTDLLIPPRVLLEAQQDGSSEKPIFYKRRQ